MHDVDCISALVCENCSCIVSTVSAFARGRLATVLKTDVVREAARKMREMRVGSVIVTNGTSNKPCGILT